MASPDPARAVPSASDRIRQLVGGVAGAEPGLEGGAGPAPLDEHRLSRSHEALERALAHEVVENPATALGQDEADAFLNLADTALRKLSDEGPDAELTIGDQMALEAVVVVDGSRPSLLIRDGGIDPTDDRLGQWQGSVVNFLPEIQAASAATARVVVAGSLSPDSVYGTAWMIAPGLAATAKHVVEGAFLRHGDDWLQGFGKPVTLDFNVEADAEPRPEARINVTGVRWASPDTIGHVLDLDNLDVAVLELEEEGPPPLTLASTLSFPAGPPRIHVIGHPRKPMSFGAASHETFETIQRLVFGDTFGVKRWSPGEMMIGPGTLDEDTDNRVMTHDASTLGGNSGSPVLDLTSIADRVMGLHYGGYFEKQNYAHPMSALQSDWAALGPPGPRFV